MNSLTLPYDSQARQPLPNRTQRKRGKINTVACARCKRDKKKCDGNYLTNKECRYCRNHGVVCDFSEINLLRIYRILNTAAKNAAAKERKDDPEKPIQDSEKKLTAYENIIANLARQLENKNKIEQSTQFIDKLYLSLFANPQISTEQTIILKRLCEITTNPANLNANVENIDKIRNKLLIIASDDRADAEKSHSWEELAKFVEMCDNNVSYNIIPSDNLTASFGISYPSGSTTPIPSPQTNVHATNNNHWEMCDNNVSYNIIPSDNLTASFGISYPSGSTTPIPSPQTNVHATNNHWEMCDNNVYYNIIPSDNLTASFGVSYPSGSTTPIPSPQTNVHATNNHVTAIRRRDSKKFETNYEPYPSGGRIDVRPSGVWQDNLHEYIPMNAMIAVHAPQNHSIRSNEMYQNPNVQLGNTSSDENFQIPTSNLLLSSLPYGLDEVGQFSNTTSPTFSSNSISDINLEYPTFISQNLGENWLGIFQNSL